MTLPVRHIKEERVRLRWLRLLAPLSVVPALLSSCMLATQQDLLKVDQNLSEMRKQQADLISKMTELDGNIQALNSQLGSSQQRMSSLSQKLDDLQADILRRLSQLSGQVSGATVPGTASPTDMYRLAAADFQAGKFELALVGFRNIVGQYPKADIAAQAQFLIGESESARKNYLDAAREYELVALSYPKSDFAAKAAFKKGVALQNAGKTADARDALRQFIKDYPRHELTKSARELLKGE